MNNEFNVKDSIYLTSRDYELDLHNDYNFTGIHYSVAERRATLLWERNDGEWVSQKAPASVEIGFRGVSRFQFLPRDPKIPFSEDDCLSTAGYWTDDDWCDGVFSTENDPDPEWLRAFEFMSGATILIKADEAQATINRYRDREEPHSSPLPHHAAYGSVLRGSADQANSAPGERKPK